MTNESKSEWKGKWKNVSVHGEIEFRERVAQLLAKSKKSTLFSLFAKASCSKPGNCFSTYTFIPLYNLIHIYIYGFIDLLRSLANRIQRTSVYLATPEPPLSHP